MARRARFFDIGSYAPATIRRYEYELRPYYRAAEVDGCDARRPPVAWVAACLHRLYKRSPIRAKQRASALRFFFRREGLPDITQDPAVQRVLFPKPSPGLEWSENIPARDRYRAEYFHEHARAESTKEGYRRWQFRWKAHARALGHDPLHPSSLAFSRWIAGLSSSYAYSTVKSARDALSDWFRHEEVPDLARGADVDKLLDGLKRTRPGNPPDPLFLNQLRRIVAPLGRSPLDVRDRLLILVNTFGVLPRRALRQLMRNKAHVLPDGVEFLTAKRRIVIGADDDPELDVRLWLKRLLEIEGTDVGALFAGIGKRGSFRTIPLDPSTISKIIMEHARRAGIKQSDPAEGLRRGFAMTAIRKKGAVVVAHHMGTTVHALERKFPQVARQQRLMRAQRRKRASV